MGFGEIGEGLHVEVAGAVEPFFVLFGGEGAEEAQAAGVVGEDAHDQRTAFEFLVEAFEEVGAFEVFVMGLREAVEGEGFLDLFLDPGGEFAEKGSVRAYVQNTIGGQNAVKSRFGAGWKNPTAHRRP